MKKIIKKVGLFILLFGFFLIINSGFKFDSWQSLFQSLVFTVITQLLIFKPWIKKVLIILSLILFIIMIIFFVLDIISTSNFFGSLAFGVLFISSLFYLPKIIKHGYI